MNEVTALEPEYQNCYLFPKCEPLRATTMKRMVASALLVSSVPVELPLRTRTPAPQGPITLLLQAAMPALVSLVPVGCLVACTI